MAPGTGAQSQRRGEARSGPPAAFEGMHAIVVHPEDADGATLLRELRRCGCVARGIWPPPQRLPEQIDALFCYLDPGIKHLLIPAGDQLSGPVIGIVERNMPDLFPLLHDCVPLAVLHKPIAPEQIKTSLYLARQIFQYQNRLLKRVGKLDETLKSIRNVERAKAILMKLRNLDEHEAYHFIRRQAMEKRVPVGIIASTIIDANEILR